MLSLLLPAAELAWRDPSKSERQAIRRVAATVSHTGTSSVQVSNIQVSTVGPWASATVGICFGSQLDSAEDILHKVHGRWRNVGLGTAGEWCVMSRADRQTWAFRSPTGAAAKAPKGARRRWRTSFCSGVLLALLGAGNAYGVMFERSREAPGWARQTSHCVRSLTSASQPSGVVGYIGYNVGLLMIVKRTGETCASAKRLAYSDWVQGGRASGLKWRYARAWRTDAPLPGRWAAAATMSTTVP